MPWEDPATAFRSAGHVIPPEIAAKKAAAAIAEAQAVADQAQARSLPKCSVTVLSKSAHSGVTAITTTSASACDCHT